MSKQIKKSKKKPPIISFLFVCKNQLISGIPRNIKLPWSIVFFKGVIPGIQHLTKQNWLFLILSGMATGLSWLFYFKALQAGKVSQVAPVDKLSVALTILLSVIFLKESLTLKDVAGALLIIAGTVVLIAKF